MRKTLTILLFLALLPHALNAANYQILKSDEGQQVILGDEKRLTVFSDTTATVGDPIAIYLDSSHLEKDGYNIMEWYYLDEVGKHYVRIKVTKAKLRLPLYILEDENDSEISVPLAGIMSGSGSFKTHGIRIKVEVNEDKDGVSVEIPN